MKVRTLMTIFIKGQKKRVQTGFVNLSSSASQ
jgi:hypothetical protein